MHNIISKGTELGASEQPSEKGNTKCIEKMALRGFKSLNRKGVHSPRNCNAITSS